MQAEGIETVVEAATIDSQSAAPPRSRRIRMLVGGLAAVRGVGGHLTIPLLAVVRGTPFLGLVLVRPNEASLAIGGAQASAGRLSWTALLVAAVVGAVASDALSYALGRIFGEAALTKVTASRHGHRVAPMIERTRRMVERRGVIAVALARPTIVSHGVTPILAGVGGLRLSSFVGAATVGATAWAAIWLGGAALVVDAVRRGAGTAVIAVTVAIAAATFLAIRARARRPTFLGAAP